jgi:hypothetical protein
MIYSHSQSYIEYMGIGMMCSYTEYFPVYMGMIYCHIEYFIE